MATVAPTVAALVGTSAANTLNGTPGHDLISGLEGNDTLVSGDGSDRMIGGLGADVLWGGASTTAASPSNGSDTYVWAMYDGNDTINDWGQSLTEMDTLELTNVASTEVRLSYANSTGADLLITITTTGEVIRIDERYQNTAYGYGIERIVFGSGQIWNLDEILRQTKFADTWSANTLTGTSYSDNLLGLSGNDTLIGGLGGDQLTGGQGADVLWGDGNAVASATSGNDTYVWAKGDGNDTINDWSQSLTEVDTLRLTDVASTDVALTFSSALGADLLVTVVSTGEVIRIDERYQNIAYGYGIERILFSDGLSWSLDEMLARVAFRGDANANALVGTTYRDNLYGLAGNDTLTGNAGDDHLIGGLGNDVLYGGYNQSTIALNPLPNGMDTYVWSRGDGNDTINDWSHSTTEVDTLVLANVLSSEVTLSRANNAFDLRASVIGSPTVETITVNSRFYDLPYGYGIEQITFADGVLWTLQDILARTKVEGTTAGETLSGVAYRDNLYGLAGNDTLNGNNGDDVLVGGAGNDSLAGGNGSDVYEWQKGGGNDTINDAGTTTTEVDTLILKDVVSTGAVLAKSGANLTVTVPPTGEVITVLNRFATTGGMAGVEAIQFSDGVVTRVLKNQVALFATNGTTAGEALTGTIYSDSISGLAGADTITASSGDDTIVGGTGNDTLQGGDGSDSYYWTKGDGNDNIQDLVSTAGSVDTLHLTNVLSNDVALSRVTNLGAPIADDLRIAILSTGEVVFDSDRFVTGSNSGMERIVFADGVIWDLAEIYLRTKFEGTTAAETLTGTARPDNMWGLAGNDVLNGGDGDDVLIGGAGNDQLAGANGNDAYEWTKTEGNDTINDMGASLTEVDTLVLKNVASTDVISLSRATGSADMTILIGATNETIRITNQYSNVANGSGIERIIFSDGVAWQRDDILGRANWSGTAGNDSLGGGGFDDNIRGLAGLDTLTGGLGDDLLDGGLAVDQLDGGAGNDVFDWRHGDASDALSDTGTSAYETDILRLVGVNKTAVELRRISGSNDLNVEVVDGMGVKETVIVRNQFLDPASGVALEGIQFDDGTIWTRSSILSLTGTYGTSSNDQIIGSASNDRMFGGTGDDTLTGGAGIDALYGGDGNDLFLIGSALDYSIGDVIGGDAGTDELRFMATTAGRLMLTSTMTSVERVVIGTGAAAAAVLSGTTALNINASAVLNGLTIVGNAGSNSLTGTGFTDILDGNAGNDTLSGGAGNDTVTGGDGTDTASYADATGEVTVSLAVAGAQNTGGAGTDVLVTIENLTGSGFNDSLTGDSMANQILCGSGNDTLTGGSGADSLYGGDGNDLILINSLAEYATGEVISGDAGADELRFTSTAAETLVLASSMTTVESVVIGTGTAGAAILTGTTALNINASAVLNGLKIIGNAGSNSLTGTSLSDGLEGGAGNDTLAGGAGNDTQTGGQGVDALYGGDGDDLFMIEFESDYNSGSTQDVVSGGAGTDELRFTGIGTSWAETLVLSNSLSSVERVVIGTGAAATAGSASNPENIDASAVLYGLTMIGNFGNNGLTGTAFADNLDGSSGNDMLVGGAGDDTLTGGWGNDNLYGGLGNDVLIGGDGTSDSVDYFWATSGVTVNLAVTVAQNTGAEGMDVITTVENVFGSEFNDGLTGDSLANFLQGGGGNDTLTGGLGADTLNGGLGNDLFVVASWNDYAAGEVISGQSGTDELRYAATWGGLPIPILELTSNMTSVERVVIGTGTATSAVTTGTTTLSINASAVLNGLTMIGNAGSNSLTGTAFGDSLDGGIGDDVLTGGAGNDSLIGGTGNDNLVGGTGNDMLTGGLGVDQFVFSSTSGGIDTITDFNQLDGGADEFDVMRFEGLRVGTFAYLGTSAFTGGSDNSEARVAGNQVFVDTNGDGTTDITVTLTGLTSASQLAADDFLFA